MIVAKEDHPDLDIHNIADFFAHLLRRVDWQRDLHFQTCTTIDTLDYSGTGLNEGSKLVIAAAGPPRRQLPTEVPAELNLPNGFREPRLCLPGVLAIKAPPCLNRESWNANRQLLPPCAGNPGSHDSVIQEFCKFFELSHPINRFPLLVLVDDSNFTAQSLKNFLWVTFTRSNPAADIDGVGSFIHQKHWGCRGSLVIDACMKPHHAPPLIEDPDVAKTCRQTRCAGWSAARDHLRIPIQIRPAGAMSSLELSASAARLARPELTGPRFRSRPS